MAIFFHQIDEPRFELFGFHWHAQDFLLKRLPVRTDLLFRPALDSLAWNPAGGRLRFRTNSPECSNAPSLPRTIPKSFRDRMLKPPSCCPTHRMESPPKIYINR